MKYHWVFTKREILPLVTTPLGLKDMQNEIIKPQKDKYWMIPVSKESTIVKHKEVDTKMVVDGGRGV